MSPTDPSPPRRPFQFTLATLLLVAVLFSILAAALGGMLHPRSGGVHLPRGFFIAMAVIAPIAAMIVLSVVRAVLRKSNRRDRRR